MSGASAVVILGGGGAHTNVEYDTPYGVAIGDTAENTGTGAVELHFTTTGGTSVIPLAGLSGYEFQEAGSITVYQ